MWGERERVVWSICVAQAIKLFKALPPKVLIIVNVYTSNDNYLEAEQYTQDTKYV